MSLNTAEKNSTVVEEKSDCKASCFKEISTDANGTGSWIEEIFLGNMFALG